MNDNSDLLPNLTHEDAFEVQMRGYSRRQVDEFIAARSATWSSVWPMPSTTARS
jgi:hypothetical protein